MTLRNASGSSTCTTPLEAGALQTALRGVGRNAFVNVAAHCSIDVVYSTGSTRTYARYDAVNNLLAGRKHKKNMTTCNNENMRSSNIDDGCCVCCQLLTCVW